MKISRNLLSRLFVPMLACSATGQHAAAGELEIPLQLDYRIVHQALVEQLFTEPDSTANVFTDRSKCNSLVLSEPEVAGTSSGKVLITTRASARGGTPVAGRCLLPFNWRGRIEVLENAQLQGNRITFQTADSRLLHEQEGKISVPGVLWGWIKQYVHPRLEATSVNLEPVLTGIQQMLDSALPPPVTERESLPPPLTLKRVAATPTALATTLSLYAPTQRPTQPAISKSAFSEEELAQWDAAWQAWDGFGTWLIKLLFRDLVSSDPELRQALAEILLEARYDLREALAGDDRTKDPVRELFLKTWERLAPLLKDNSLAIPGGQALSYASFISAGDALAALDRAAPRLGMRIDSQTFRQLARLLTPGIDPTELDYDTGVDPELRELLGLDPEFEVDEEEAPVPLSWLFPAVRAASIDSALVRKLTGWVPDRDDIDVYIPTMEQLFDQIIRTEAARGKVPGPYLDVYKPLLLATAWQETCWRQYVRKNGRVQPILSYTGSVGLMQINQKVWRGVYDLQSLNDNIGYNARAGNEILVHYLVDYVIRKKEHQVSGQPDSMARATYAIYNGGPGHMTRYRKANASGELAAIDAAFWEKYRTMRGQGPQAVSACYGI